MNISKIIIYVLAVLLLFTLLWSCAKKEDKPEEESEAKSESYSQSPTDENQMVTSEEIPPEASTPAIPAKTEKETGTNGVAQLQKQIEEVRKTFLSFQEVCKANDIEEYLDFWDYETKMIVDGRDLDLNQRRERRRESLKKRPEILQEIANAKIESIIVNTSQAEKVKEFFGVEIKETMMLVRTSSRDYLFHETAKGWKLFTIASPGYFP